MVRKFRQLKKAHVLTHTDSSFDQTEPLLTRSWLPFPSWKTRQVVYISVLFVCLYKRIILCSLLSALGLVLHF